MQCRTVRRTPGRGRARRLPNPVPGEDPSKWGCPVTLQLFHMEVSTEPEMRLLTPDGRAVDCHWSTPQYPTNPELAPSGAFCLMPKAALLLATTYRVVVTGLPGETSQMEWSFTTRAR
jgi:hypothetical protein